MLKYVTAGESHGPALITVIEGLPAGLKIDKGDIDHQLVRRQSGFGRGGRMAIEKDSVQILSGIRFGLSLGSPIALMIENRDWQNWLDSMNQQGAPLPGIEVTQPRPGHADLPGILKTGQSDVRNILERSSARETAARVAAGAVARALLQAFGITVVSHVVAIGGVTAASDVRPVPSDIEKVDASEVRCFDDDAGRSMVEAITKARDDKNTIGGIFEVLVYGCPPGLGSYASWENRLDAKLARAIVGIQAIKGVEFGDGFGIGSISGSQAHDEIFYSREDGYFRKTNHAGGIEGGMTNGETIVLRAVMKPIPTLMQPLHTVDIKTKQEVEAIKERSDVCAVPAAAVVGEAVVAFEIAAALLDKFGSDAIEDVMAAYRHYLDRIIRS